MPVASEHELVVPGPQQGVGMGRGLGYHLLVRLSRLGKLRRDLVGGRWLIFAELSFLIVILGCRGS